MKKNMALVGLAACLSFTSIFAYGQEISDPTKELDEEIILIETVGNRPGPPLWQVSNGTNVVWIFGIPSPYHKDDLKWDRSSVRDIMAEADVFIPAPEMKMPFNPIKKAQLALAVTMYYIPPNRERLEDLISEDLYERFEEQKNIYWPKGILKFLPTNSNLILNFRPRVVGHMLFSKAIGKSGLKSNLLTGSRSKISKAIARIARSKGVETISLHQTWDAQDFKEFGESEEWDIACLETVLDSLEQDIDGMISRSQAWANGDVSAYREYNYPHPEQACQHITSQRITGLLNEQLNLREQWLDTIDEALIQYESTFSTMTIEDLVKPEGLLEQLIERGYSVRIL